MKILQLISSAGFFGAESVLLELSHALRGLGHEAIVGVFHNRHRPNLELAEAAGRTGLRTQVFECRGKFDLGAAWRIATYVREQSVEVIHSHGYKSNTYALLSNWRNRRVLVSTCHNWINASSKMRVYGQFDRLVLKGFDAVVPVSHTVRDELVRSGFDPAVLPVVENGINVGRYGDSGRRDAVRREFGFDVGCRVIGTVGRLSPEKAQDSLLQAVQRLPAGLNWRLLIVGDGELRHELEQTARQLGIADRTVFAGRRTDVPDVLQALDLFALPSRVEALPMALLEAMASGVPVVASDVGDVSRILQQGALGAIVPVGDVVALSSALREGLTHLEVTRTRAGLAREQVRQVHSSERMARDYLGIYARAAAVRAKA